MLTENLTYKLEINKKEAEIKNITENMKKMKSDKAVEYRKQIEVKDLEKEQAKIMFSVKVVNKKIEPTKSKEISNKPNRDRNRKAKARNK